MLHSLQVLSDVIQNGSILDPEELFEIISGDEVNIVDEVLARKISYPAEVHSNGYLKIRVIDFGSHLPALRLHKWGPESAFSDVHTHCWRMISYIAEGAVCNKYYQANESISAGIHCAEYEIDYENRKKTFVRDTFIQKTDEEILKKGEVYRCESNRAHSLHSDAATTLMIRGPYETKLSRMFVLSKN